jgi:hypothetical protein
MSNIELLEPIPDDDYKKINVRYKDCGHSAELCKAGIDRGISCKICNPNTKKIIKREKFIPINKKYWGSLFYKRNGSYYEIGIESGGIINKLDNCIWELPCKTKRECIGLQKLLLTVYSFKLNENGKFTENVLKNFDLRTFIYKIKRGIFFYETGKG